jgi:aminoglycoside phosphotransferase (APT) family kinase protein
MSTWPGGWWTASSLAGFLVALRGVDATDGPGPDRHNFFRGGPLAMGAGWEGGPVWFHGDVATGNLLLRDGRLVAVIDFGTSGVGDPACDVVIAWTLLSGPSRDAYRSTLGVDPGTWSRGRGWALWKALISLVGHLEEGDAEAAAAHRRVIARVLADHARDA